VKALAKGKDPATTHAGDLAQRTVVWIVADASFEEALSLMREHAVKRLPVMDENKRLCGIVTEADIATHAPGRKTGELAGASVQVVEPSAIASAPPDHF
jgi:CBS-domain-containing membrane protein